MTCDTSDDVMQPSIPENNNNDNSFFEVIWQVPLVPDTTFRFTMTPILYRESIIHGIIGFNEQNPNQIFGINKLTGEKIWYWSDPLLDSQIPNVGLYQHDKYLALSGRQRVFVVDIENGEKVWNSEYSSSNYRIKGIDENLYYTFNSEGFDHDTAHLVRSSLHEENWDTIFTLTKLDLNGYQPGFGMPTEWIKPNGDTILFFQNRSFNFDINDGQIDFYAYNQTGDSVEWVNIDVTVGGNSSIYPPVVNDNKVYFQGVFGIHCFDTFTGEELWLHKDLSYGYTNNPMLLVEEKDMLILSSGEGTIFGLNAQTGDVIWENKAGGGGSGDLVYFNGRIYTTGGTPSKLFAINVTNGNTIFAERSPNYKDVTSQVRFETDLVIDTDLRYMYLSDGFYFMCIKIP